MSDLVLGSERFIDGQLAYLVQIHPTYYTYLLPGDVQHHITRKDTLR